MKVTESSMIQTQVIQRLWIGLYLENKRKVALWPKSLRFCGQTSDFFLPAFIQHILEPSSVLGARDTALNQAGEVSVPVCVTHWRALKIHTPSEASGENENNAES